MLMLGLSFSLTSQFLDYLNLYKFISAREDIDKKKSF